ncbi:MAG: hypothetical protein KDA42_10085, partial [Planctomycetales bacterium]|nr:hypothetical protein [Planctomycetales bacterium]
EPLQTTPSEGILVLRHGAILTGKVTRAGERYLLAVPGGQMQLEAADVEFFCRDIDEAYHMKRAAFAAGRAEEHLDLAAWCLKHQLIGYAARELLDARQLDARHPRIGLLDRQLEVAVARQNEAAAPRASAQPAEPRKLAETLSAELPPGCLETFTNRIQPILMNRCSRGGCHGPGATSTFQLERAAAGRTYTRRATTANLQAALQFIDMNQPAESRLLREAMAPHGTLDAPIFGASEVGEYNALVQWIDSLATPTHADAARPRSVSLSATQPIERRAAIVKASAEESIFDEPDSAGGSQRTIQRGAPVEPAKVENPYDPASFNQSASADDAGN